MTVLHNGILVQHNVELTGPTAWLTREPFSAHSGETAGRAARPRQPGEVSEQSGCGFVGQALAKDEYLLPNDLLDSYAGDYERSPGRRCIQIRRTEEGLLVFDVPRGDDSCFTRSPRPSFSPRPRMSNWSSSSPTREKKIVFSVGRGRK